MHMSSCRLSFLPRDVVVLGAARTPIGSFLGGLSSMSAAKLGSIAISNAIKRSRIDVQDVQGVVMGHVLSAGCGQAAARQASIGAKIPESVDVFAVNKVCASGLKAISLAAQSVALGHADVMVAGGMESMSQAPYYIRKAREGGYRYGHGMLEDALLTDGLWDAYNDIHMGKCAEKTVRDMGITRVEQDEYAIESYKRAADAWKGGVMEKEVIEVMVPAEKRSSATEAQFTPVSKDEQFTKIKLDKVAGLKPAFEKEGTITAANASALNDGAAAVVLCSADMASKIGIYPIARILSFADAGITPIDFPVAPNQAVRRALKAAGMQQVDYHEINEAFSAVAIANMRLLDLDHSRVNVHGGAVALGHPVGASGCRIFVSLLNVLEARDAETGCASICNGGGGATAIIVERL